VGFGDCCISLLATQFFGDWYGSFINCIAFFLCFGDYYSIFINYTTPLSSVSYCPYAGACTNLPHKILRVITQHQLLIQVDSLTFFYDPVYAGFYFIIVVAVLLPDIAILHGDFFIFLS
jgi:hypothetical protein